MSGVFQNIDPPPPDFGGGEDTFAGWRRGGGRSIFWKTPDTALYSTYVSTLWTELMKDVEGYPSALSRSLVWCGFGG
jgi:hypothetical protein